MTPETGLRTAQDAFQGHSGVVTIPDELLQEATPGELRSYQEYLAREALKSNDWRLWLAAISPQEHDFAPHHVEFWQHIWAIEKGKRPKPFVAIWPRGGAKSTSIEMATALLAAKKARRYALYVSESQDQADDHVLNVGSLIESDVISLVFPELAARSLGKYGNIRGWRRNRLMTQGGFIIDALGLDSAVRGVKIENERPDLIVIDDIDSQVDGPGVVERKIRTITRALLPAGSNDVAVVAVQNLVHPDSVFAQLADGRAEFLADRIVSGPIPAVEGLETEQVDGKWRIVAGKATWEGQSLQVCQDMISDMGLTAFLSECQHHTEPPPGGMFDHIEFKRLDPEEVPDLVKTTVWVDPAVTDKDDSDSMGIQVDGIDEDGTIYRLFSWERRATPLDALKMAIMKAKQYHAQTVGVETDQGGDTWQSVFREAASSLGLKPSQWPRYLHAKGGAVGPKTHRAQQMLTDYEKGHIVHVRGTHGVLERALRRFPKTKPFDLVDASFWSWRHLRPERKKRLIVR